MKKKASRAAIMRMTLFMMKMTAARGCFGLWNTEVTQGNGVSNVI
jgi:hypothetical protein